MSAHKNEPMPDYGLSDEFPLLWRKSQEYDFAERLGGCTDLLLAEIDAAMRELWMARAGVSGESDGPGEEISDESH